MTRWIAEFIIISRYLSSVKTNVNQINNATVFAVFCISKRVKTSWRRRCPHGADVSAAADEDARGAGGVLRAGQAGAWPPADWRGAAGRARQDGGRADGDVAPGDIAPVERRPRSLVSQGDDGVDEEAEATSRRYPGGCSSTFSCTKLFFYQRFFSSSSHPGPYARSTDSDVNGTIALTYR